MSTTTPAGNESPATTDDSAPTTYAVEPLRFGEEIADLAPFARRDRGRFE